MIHSKQQVATSAIIAILLFLAPNFVQDYHRIWGHRENPVESVVFSGFQFHNHHEKCAVCVFEFNIVEDLTLFAFAPALPSKQFVFAKKSKDQVQQTAFYYYNLRAPPKA